jgi:hypothetical protein
MQADWANKLGFEADWTSEPMYGRERNWHAVCRFFEIDIYEAKELFYPPDDLCEERYHNPVAQAAHMKEFLKQKGYYS